jgi:hypothetical protein
MERIAGLERNEFKAAILLPGDSPNNPDLLQPNSFSGLPPPPSLLLCLKLRPPPVSTIQADFGCV